MQRVPAGPVDREETPDWALGIASFLPDRRQSARTHARGHARTRAYKRTCTYTWFFVAAAAAVAAMAAAGRRLKLGQCPGARPARARAPDGLTDVPCLRRDSDVT